MNIESIRIYYTFYESDNRNMAHSCCALLEEGFKDIIIDCDGSDEKFAVILL